VRVKVTEADIATVLHEISSCVAVQKGRRLYRNKNREFPGACISIRSLAVSTGMCRTHVCETIALAVSRGLLRRLGRQVIRGLAFGCATMSYKITRKGSDLLKRFTDNPLSINKHHVDLIDATEVWCSPKLGQQGRWVYSMLQGGVFTAEKMAKYMKLSVGEILYILNTLQGVGLACNQDGQWTSHGGHEGDAMRYAAQSLGVANILLPRALKYWQETLEWIKVYTAWSPKRRQALV